MQDTQAQTESLLDIIKGIASKTIMLPEFQRDFRWEMEQTYDLFDSLIREIFIGTIIYGKPAFGMTLREIDIRPRKGDGSRLKLITHDFSTAEIIQRGQTQNFRIVLDGQQRLTSIYRVMQGHDTVYFTLKPDLHSLPPSELSLEMMLDRFGGEESSTAISVKVSDAYDFEIQSGEEETLNRKFAQSLYVQKQLQQAPPEEYKGAERLYRRAIRLLIDFFKQQKMVAFYLLDMSLDKFCLFFERSNSRGIQLNFTDILAAKLYSGFNLRKRIEEFEAQTKFKLNRELVVRALAYIRGVETGGNIKIDKSYILQNLESSDFERHWDTVCKLYSSTLNYLIQQYYILSQEWMPSENMTIPLMMFLRDIGSFEQMSESQRQFIEYWYWASVFANRYSTSTNEVIIKDITVLRQIARHEQISERGYFTRLRSLITEYEDLFSYTKRASATYRGILNLLNYNAKGLRDWKNSQILDLSMKLEDHHIYPRGYISGVPELDMDQSEAEQLVDCIANRTLMPKNTNIRVGKKPPSEYLAELAQHNTSLDICIESHLLPSNMLSDLSWSSYFKTFLELRAQAIFALIEQYAITPASSMNMLYGIQLDIGESLNTPRRGKFKDIVASGRVKKGDRLYTRKKPDAFATVIDGDIVEYEGSRYPINVWGEKVTGWSSINVYDSVILERTGKPLRSLRENEESGE